jgi:CubicO group peptidase (beta-lactamase class C family)
MIEDAIDRLAAETGFSGVVRVDALTKAYGLAHRGAGIANTVDTQFGIASGGKGFTALTVMSLVEDGVLALDTTARSVLGTDLPLIDDMVTVEHLLTHRSGIGDYYDEEADTDVNDYVMSVPVHELADTEQFVRALDGYPQKFPPGERFSYNNGAFIVLALIAERTSKTPYHELVRERVLIPAEMHGTAFLRSDEPTARAALGYLAPDGLRTNVMHLPIRGNGDGGIYSTAADIHALWTAFFAGRIVSRDTVADMVRSRSDVPRNSMRYGLGFWLHESREITMLIGSDPGVSFRTVHDPTSGLTHTVLSNTSSGAWPMTKMLDLELGIRAG